MMSQTKAIALSSPGGALDATFVARAEALLAQAVNAYEAKEIRDQIVTIETWSKERGAADTAIGHARRAKMLAEIRIGELTKDLARAPGKRTDKPIVDEITGPTKKEQLEESGISQLQASRWERLAALPKKEREEKIQREVARTTTAAGGGKKTHVAANSGENEWYTPGPIIEVVRAAMVGIDLDPASCRVANKTVQAEEFYTASDDGLTRGWHGKIYLNPPYERGLVDRFVAKLIEEYVAGRTKAACVLVNNATDTAWFQSLLGAASYVCLIEGRVRFIDKNGDPSGAPLQGQALVYLGGAGVRFCRAAKAIGICLQVV